MHYPSSDGWYHIRNLLPGSYVVTPQFAGAEFTPHMRSVSLSTTDETADFSARLSRLQLSLRYGQTAPVVQIMGIPQKRYSVETSTNLIEWHDMTNSEADAGGLLEINPALDAPQRYFRLR